MCTASTGISHLLALFGQDRRPSQFFICVKKSGRVLSPNVCRRTIPHAPRPAVIFPPVAHHFGGLSVLALRAVTLLLAIVLLSDTGVFSQEKKDTTKETTKEVKDSGKVKGTLPANFGKLGLSDQQKQEVYKIRAKYQEQKKKLEEQLEALKTDERTDLDKGLTPEQRKRLREILLGEKPKD